MTIAAIFDFDGTLFTGHTWQAIVQHHRTQRVNRHWLYLYLGTHLPLWYLHKKGFVSEARARRVWARHMGWTLRGLSEEQGKQVFRWIADRYAMPRLRQDVFALLQQHQSQAHRIVLLSGTFEPLVAAIARRLHADVALGMRLELRDHRYTGHALPPIPQGEGKLDRLRLYLDGEGRDIDLDASFSYADSITDLPVLKAVGNPVAVYPNPALADWSTQQGWPIVGEVTDE
ncbi:MAG: HAD-IB family hydrolase [Chloroflexi bacterium]|nr:HAD-IB family hydrolase [Chloroflexota bacterium]